MASKKFIAGIIAGLLLVGVVLGAVVMTVNSNNSNVVDPVEPVEQNEPVEPSQEEPVVTPGDEPEQPAEKKDRVWYVTTGGTTEPEEEVAEPTIDRIPTHIAIGRDLVVSGTADGFKGEQLIVGLISEDCPVDCFYETANVDENGSWNVTFDTTDVPARDFTVMLATETMELAVSGPISVVVGEPTLDTIPNETSFGQEFVISGTAVRYTGETVTAEIYSNTHIFGKTKTATVDENGVWEVDASDLPADDYNASFKLGDAVFAFQTFKIVMEAPTVDQYPEHITIGQEAVVISGTAVSFKGETINVKFISANYSADYDVHKTTTVDENGSWSITIDTTTFVVSDLYDLVAYTDDGYGVGDTMIVIEIEEPTVNSIPEHITIGQEVVFSGTAVSFKGKTMSVDLVSQAHSSLNDAYTTTTIDENGFWSITIDSSNFAEDLYKLYIYTGEYDGVEPGDFTIVYGDIIVVEAPVQQETETTKQIEEPLVTESLEELL